MKFSPPLARARLIKRYKRFMADVELPGGQVITLHCPNTGSMKNCLVPGSDCWYSDSGNPKRKYPCTWEIATTPGRGKAGINTGRANALVMEAIEAGVIKELQGYASARREVAYGSEGSRIDILLSDHPRRRQSHCYVEVKNLTLHESKGVGLFPDAVSERGRKHLRELMEMVNQGHRAVLFFCVQHNKVRRASPAWDIDPLYAETLEQAVEKGVEVLAYRAKLNAREIVLEEKIPFVLGRR